MPAAGSPEAVSLTQSEDLFATAVGVLGRENAGEAHEPTRLEEVPLGSCQHRVVTILLSPVNGIKGPSRWAGRRPGLT